MHNQIFHTQIETTSSNNELNVVAVIVSFFGRDKIREVSLSDGMMMMGERNIRHTPQLSPIPTNY